MLEVGTSTYDDHDNLGGGFKHVLFLHILPLFDNGEDEPILTGAYFSDGLS